MAKTRIKFVMPRAAAKRVRFSNAQKARAGEGRVPHQWKHYFLAALAETSNVSEAARIAGVSLARAYKTRRERPDFAAAWRDALAEGYDQLEQELLAHLRGAAAGRIEAASAIRLLTAHRKAVAEVRAAQEPDSDAEVRAALDTMFERMRREAAEVDAAHAADEADPAP